MTTQTNGDELERKKFEAWASDGGKFPRAIERRDGEYLLMATQCKWETWQAALSSKQEGA